MTVTYHDEGGALPARRIVALTVDGERLVRTKRFRNPVYVGDPLNALRIFSAKGADEVVLLRIDRPVLDSGTIAWLRDMASEAFMPISFGGGIRSLRDVETVIRLGFEKVVLNTVLHEGMAVATQAAAKFGSQAVVASIEVSRSMFRGSRVVTGCGTRRTALSPAEWAKRCEDGGCGEVMVTSIDRDGLMTGLDIDLIHEVSTAVSIPVIAMGGAGLIQHMDDACAAGAAACAAGSMFVFHGPRRAVLINYSTSQVSGE